MTGIILSILSGFMFYTGNDTTGYIQEQYVIENYFNWVDEQAPIVYRRGRILGQKFETYINGEKVKGRQYTNRSDCGGIIVGYLMNLGLITSRWKDDNGISFTYDGGGLNSFRIYKMGIPIQRKKVKKGDFVYMEFGSGRTHIAVACDDGGKNIYDLYRDSKAKCRPQPPTTKLLYSKNWIPNFLKWKGIVLSGTQEILDIYSQFDKIPYSNYYYNALSDMMYEKLERDLVERNKQYILSS